MLTKYNSNWRCHQLEELFICLTVWRVNRTLMSTMENSDISSDPAVLLEDQYQFLFWVLVSQFSLGLDLTCCEPCFVTRLHGDRPIKSGRRLGLRIRVWFLSLDVSIDDSEVLIVVSVLVLMLQVTVLVL